MAGQIIKPMAEHWKALDSAVEYILNEPPYKGLILKRPKNFKLYIYADLDYSNNENGRKSISGRISTLGRMIVG